MVCDPTVCVVLNSDKLLNSLLTASRIDLGIPGTKRTGSNSEFTTLDLESCPNQDNLKILMYSHVNILKFCCIFSHNLHFLLLNVSFCIYCDSGNIFNNNNMF